MRTGGYTWRRTRARTGLVGLLLTMSALVVVALAGTLAYLDVASNGGVRDAIDAVPPTARVQVTQTRQADDADRQHADTAAVIERLLPDAQAWSVVRTPPLQVSDTEQSVVLLVDDGADDAATLTDGSWPAAATETSLHAEAARALGLGTGDTLEVTAEDTVLALTVVGLWQPRDADATRWAGDRAVADGVDPSAPDSYGPALVTAAALDGLDVDPFVRWAVTPGSALTPDSLPRWLDGLPALAPTLDADGLTVRGVLTSGTLESTLADAQESVTSVRASSAIPLVIVALVSLVALWQITRLLVAVRERETLVLLSRGAAPAQVVAIAAAEAGLVALGAVAGGAAVTVALADRPGFAWTPVAAVTIGVAVAVVAVLLAGAARAAVTGLRPTGESGRARAALTGSLLVLVGALAAFSLWRLARNGTPLVPGTQQVDVVAVGGPALGLVAVALVAVAVAGPVLRGSAAVAARRPGFSPVTELRQSSRRIAVNAVPVVLVVLATAIATVASGYAGTWQALRTTSAQVSLGADVRVDAASGIAASRPRGVADVAATDGAAGATGVLQAPVLVDETTAALTALPMVDVGLSSAPAELLGDVVPRLRPDVDPLPGIDLPPDAAELSLTATASAQGQTLESPRTRDMGMRVWLSAGAELVVLELPGWRLVATDRAGVDPDTGELVAIDDPAAGAPVTETATASLPPGAWRLVAVDTVMQTSYGRVQWQVSVDAIEVDGQDVLTGSDVAWDAAVRPMPGQAGDYTTLDGLAFSGLYAGEVVGARQALVSSTVQRFMPETELGVTVPVAVTGPLTGLVRTSGTDAQVSATVLPLVQVATIAVVPGNPAPAAALADLPTLQNAMLRSADDVPAITQIWADAVATATPQQLAEALRADVPSRVVVATGDGVTDTVASPARIVYWVAAACALLLALPAIVAVAMTQASSRRGEVVVLRAVGVGPTAQGRSRRRELLGIEIGAVVAGVLAGWLLCRLVMVDLIRSTTPQTSRAVPLELTFDWRPGAVLVGVIVVTLAAVALWYGARVRAQARDTTWREEIR